MSVLRIVFPACVFIVGNIEEYLRLGSFHKTRHSLLITPLNSNPFKGVKMPV